MCVLFSSVHFYHMWTITWSAPQLRYRTVPSHISHMLPCLTIATFQSLSPPPSLLDTTNLFWGRSIFNSFLGNHGYSLVLFQNSTSAGFFKDYLQYRSWTIINEPFIIHFEWSFLHSWVCDKKRIGLCKTLAHQAL